MGDVNSFLAAAGVRGECINFKESSSFTLKEELLGLVWLISESLFVLRKQRQDRKEEEEEEIGFLG